MIRRSTWGLLIVLLGLIGLSLYLGAQKSREAAEATPTLGSSRLFETTADAPTDIKIENSAGKVVEIARDANGQWVLKSPAVAAADQAAAEAAATQIGALRLLATVELSPAIVGLDKPEYTITLSFGASTQRKLLVGSVTPINDGYYVQLDGGRNQIVDKGGVDALLSLLTHPPYLATPTLPATTTPSPEGATATPTGTPSSALPAPVVETGTP